MLTIPVPSLGAAKENPGTAALFGSKAKAKAPSAAKNPFGALLASLREGKAESAENKNSSKKGGIELRAAARDSVAHALGNEAAKPPAKESSALKPSRAAGDGQAELAGTELSKIKGKRDARKVGEPSLSLAAPLMSQAGREALKMAAKPAEAAMEGDKPAEASQRKDAKRGGDAKYSVIDLRLKIDAKESPESQKGSRSGGAERVEAPALSRVDGAGARSGETEGQPKAAELKPSAGGFSEVLAERLRANSTDFVRAAQVVLKDGNLGLIRLRLEPEHLGGVKIELKLAEKQISGRIIVESDLAGEAFRSSLESLKDAFASAGFETSSLEVEVRNGNGQQGGARQDGGAGEPGSPQWSARLRELDAAVPLADGSGADGALNMIV
jgi:flagellar hook-length control protein FliK